MRMTFSIVKVGWVSSDPLQQQPYDWGCRYDYKTRGTKWQLKPEKKGILGNRRREVTGTDSLYF